MSIYNESSIDTTKQPMFFGEPLAVQRYDNFKYPIFDTLTDKQHSFFWRPQEVSLSKDIADYKDLRPEEQFIFLENLKYQTLLDSIQGRGPTRLLGRICSIPELEACIEAWTFFETIHSRSYTYIMKNLVPNPSVIFDDILVNEQIKKRASSITSYYDNFEKLLDKYFADPSKVTKYELYKELYLLLIVINALEGLRFFVSFACSFTFAKNKKMEGSAKIVSLISSDEFLHLAITQNIINLYKKSENDPLMLQVIDDTQGDVGEIYKQVVAQEKEWADHLFNDGRGMLGLSAKLLHNYIEYLGNKRLKSIGYSPLFPEHKTNPFEHLESFFNPRNLQVAPQETELSTYITSGTKQDVDATTFSNFEL